MYVNQPNMYIQNTMELQKTAYRPLLETVYVEGEKLVGVLT